MPKRRRSKLEKEVDREFKSMTKEEALAQFDESQALYVPARKTESKLISIRLPIAMIQGLRAVAIQKGDVGYQQLIKIFITDGLLRSGANITSHGLQAKTVSTLDTREPLLNLILKMPATVKWQYPKVA